jgi:hypothetical protein
MITEKTAEKLGTMVGYGALIGAVVFGFTACGKKEEARATVTPAAVVAPAVVTPKAEPVVESPKAAPVELADGWEWTNPSDMFLKLQNVKIKNNTNQDIKDPEISCSAYGESGTRIDSNHREQFKIIKAGETITLGDVDMGFLRSQADKVGCRISNYKKV